MRKLRNILFVICIINGGVLLGIGIHFYTTNIHINKEYFVEEGIKRLVSQTEEACIRVGFNRVIFSDEIELTPEEQGLKEDISSLVRYELFRMERVSFTLVVPLEEYHDYIKSYTKKLKELGFSDDKITENLKKLKEKGTVEPTHRLILKWRWVPGEEGRLINLSLIISETQGQKQLPPQEVKLYHPYYENYLLKKRGFLQVLLISGGVGLVVFFLAFIVVSFMYKTRRREIESKLPQAMEELEDLLKADAYDTAYEYALKLLDYCDDTKISAIKNRILDRTKGNPREATMYKVKLKELENLICSGCELTEDQYKELRRKCSYYFPDEAGRLINLYENIKQRRIFEQRLQKDVPRIKSLVEEGRLSEASAMLQNIITHKEFETLRVPAQLDGEVKSRLVLPSGEEFYNRIVALSEEIERRREESLKYLERAKQEIKRGMIKEGMAFLESALRSNKELKEGEEIYKMLKSAREAPRLVLSPEKIGKKIYIFKKDAITLFRRDTKEPDVNIDNPKVSRDRHLKLIFVENRLIAEDMGSTNGTFVRGKRIEKVEIMDGDIIDIAGVYKMTAHISKGGRAVCATIPIGGAEIKSEAGEKIERDRSIKGCFLEGDDRDIILLVERVPIFFKPIGIIYDESGDCNFVLKDGVVLLQTPEEYYILHPGATIEYRGIKYLVSE